MAAVNEYIERWNIVEKKERKTDEERKDGNGEKEASGWSPKLGPEGTVQ
jgi:hypothetical protein